jgi:hypothetical protein
MRIVDGCSTALGYAVSASGDGKVVWATLRVRPAGVDPLGG